MGFVGEWLRRLSYLFNRRRYERELQREMQIHREMLGETARFGNTLRLREESRDVWAWNWLDSAWLDLKFAGRTLWQSRGFALGAVIILSLGIGLNLTLFQIYNNVVLKPLPVRDVKTLVELGRMSATGGGAPMSYPMAEFIRSHNSILAAVLTTNRWKTILWEDSEDRLPACFVSSNWFDELGYSAAAQGRLFHEGIDDKPDAPPAVAVNYRFWTTRLGGDPRVVGSTIRINDRPATLIGVVPEAFPAFVGGRDPMVWMPIEQFDYFFPDVAFKTAWDNGDVHLFARLKSGVSSPAVRQAMRPVMDELALEHPENVRKGGWLEPYPATNRFERPPQRTQRLANVAGFGFLSLLVLAVACANLGNLVLSRSIGRLRELSVRTALGASRWRVIRALLAESVLLAGAASIVGLGISYGVIRGISVSTEMPMDASPDWRTMVALFIVAGFAMIAVGFIPTWTVTRRDLGAAIKDGGEQASSGLGQTRLRSLLSSVQVAGSCILLLLAVLAARNLLGSLAPGFDFDNVAVFEPSGLGNAVQTSRGQDGRKFDLRLFWSGVRPAIAALPETADSALVSTAPFVGPFQEANKLPEAPDLSLTLNDVEGQFFKVMRIPILEGRPFDASDDRDSSVIISRRLAMVTYGTLNVVGRTFPRTSWLDQTDQRRRRIVGVSEDARMVHMDFANGAEYYLPFSIEKINQERLIVRARTNPRALVSAMREASRKIDPHFKVEARLLSADYANSLHNAYLLAAMSSGLASLTLLLACLGIFGVISYGASLRRKELSIRMALGASQRSVVTLLMRQSAWPAFYGMLSGLVLSIVAARILHGQIGSPPLDASVLASVATVLALTCGIAAFLPALKAVRGDIAQTLRRD